MNELQGVSTRGPVKKTEEKIEMNESHLPTRCTNAPTQQTCPSLRQHVQPVSPDATPLHIPKGLVDRLQYRCSSAVSSTKIAAFFHHERWVILDRRTGAILAGGDGLKMGARFTRLHETL